MGNVFKRNVLAAIPANAVIVEKDGKRFAKWTEAGRNVTREVVTTKKGSFIVTGESAVWYGKVKTAPKRWEVKKLYTDKTASVRRLTEMQKDADQWDSGVKVEAVEKLNRPIKLLRDEYLADLTRTRKRPDHVKIVTFMTDRLIELGTWKYFRDITHASVSKIAEGIVADGNTVRYANHFITRAKAFVNHFLPDGVPSPLVKLKRIRLRGAKQTRDRRAARTPEVSALLTSAIPKHRQLAYALAALNGLRRNEAEWLTWENVHLRATVPYIELPQKMGSDDTMDVIPLHPYVISLLTGREREAAEKVVGIVPKVPTLDRDWTRIGVTMTDEKGRRLDYHALRHTFQTELDRTGCSRATKQRLMRHAGEDVTDGYAHAELAEMQAALQRIPSPPPAQPEAQQLKKTGTTDTAVGDTKVAPLMHQKMGTNCLQSSTSDLLPSLAMYLGSDDPMSWSARENQGIFSLSRESSTSDLNESAGAANVSKTGAISSVG
jgi:integrase